MHRYTQRDLDGAVDNGDGYGLRACAAEGCGALLAYPDEGTACADHTCAGCGTVVNGLSVYPLPYRDTHTRRLEVDTSATACERCFVGVMMRISPAYGERMNRLGYAANVAEVAR
jgi:hypothetical protein